MAFYMWSGAYTADEVKAMVETPQDREVLARQAIESLGGKLHHYFFSFGQHDIIVIMEFADDVDMAALALRVTSNGYFSHGETTKLLTSADAMSAISRAKAAMES